MIEEPRDTLFNILRVFVKLRVTKSERWHVEQYDDSHGYASFYGATKEYIDKYSKVGYNTNMHPERELNYKNNKELS